MILSSLFLVFIFTIFIISVLLIDLLWIGKKSHVLSFKEALTWTCVWMSLAFMFYGYLFFRGEQIHGITNLVQLQETAEKYKLNIVIDDDYEKSIKRYRIDISTAFLAGYIIEESLSVDNLFVIAMILTTFAVREKYYKKVLFWGILGAIVFRFIFIFIGAELVSNFNFVLILFGVLLIFSGIKMLLHREDKPVDIKNNFIIRQISKYCNVYPKYIGGRFIVGLKKKKGVWITPLFVVLMLIECTDIIFAFDSIPAIFAISCDPYVIFLSNVFAILGLRSMFFLLARCMKIFKYLKYGISVILIFVGLKLLFGHILLLIGFTTLHSLLVIIFILLLSVLISVFNKEEVVI